MGWKEEALRAFGKKSERTQRDQEKKDRELVKASRQGHGRIKRDLASAIEEVTDERVNPTDLVKLYARNSDGVLLYEQYPSLYGVWGVVELNGVQFGMRYYQVSHGMGGRGTDYSTEHKELVVVQKNPENTLWDVRSADTKAQLGEILQQGFGVKPKWTPNPNYGYQGGMGPGSSTSTRRVGGGRLFRR